MHVRFTEDFDYTPSEDHRVLVAFKKGWQGTVRREAGEAAVAAGKAVEVASKSRKAADAEA